VRISGEKGGTKAKIQEKKEKKKGGGERERAIGLAHLKRAWEGPRQAERKRGGGKKREARWARSNEYRLSKKRYKSRTNESARLRYTSPFPPSTWIIAQEEKSGERGREKRSRT